MKLKFTFLDRPEVHADGIFISIYAYHKEAGISKTYEIGPIEEENLGNIVASLLDVGKMTTDEQYRFFKKVCDYEEGMNYSYFTIHEWKDGKKYPIEVKPIFDTDGNEDV